MKRFLRAIMECAIFEGIGEPCLEKTLRLLDAHVKDYKKNDTVWDFNNGVGEMGIIVEGSCQIAKTDSEGNRAIFRNLGVGRTFGETLIFAGIKEAPIIVTAAGKCTVVFLDAKRIVDTLAHASEAQIRMAQNIVSLLAQEAVAIVTKNDILSKRTIRSKLLTYFVYQNAQKDMIFKVPFSHEELADYLSVNRSALSRELTLMRKEGLISYDRHCFKIKQNIPDNEFKQKSESDGYNGY